MTDTELPVPSISVTHNGPYRVNGAGLALYRRVLGENGRPVDWERRPGPEHGETFDLCRCGASMTMPFCDGSESKVGFDGTEVADRGPTEDRRRGYGGGPLVLTDDVSLCAAAGFCTAREPDAWDLAERSAEARSAERLRGIVQRCPSGRLVLQSAGDASALEDESLKEIGVVQDGPYWVRGGIQITSEDGFGYQVRNRVALCRCGHSRNKPFCDGTHARIRFTDPPAG